MLISLNKKLLPTRDPENALRSNLVSTLLAENLLHKQTLRSNLAQKLWHYKKKLNVKLKKQVLQIKLQKLIETLESAQKQNSASMAKLEEIAIKKLSHCYQLEIEELNCRAEILTKSFSKNITEELIKRTEKIIVPQQYYQNFYALLVNSNSSLVNILSTSSDLQDEKIILSLQNGTLEYNLTDELRALLE